MNDAPQAASSASESAISDRPNSADDARHTPDAKTPGPGAQQPPTEPESKPEQMPVAQAGSTPEATPATKKKPHRLRKWLVRIGLVLIVVYLARSILIGPILAEIAESVASDALGATVEIEAVEGSYFGSLKLVGVSLSQPPDTLPIRQAYIGEAVAEYSLFELFGGGLEFLDRVKLAHVTADIDLRHTAPAEETPAEKPTELPKSFPTRLPIVTAENVAVRVAMADGQWARFDGISIDGRNATDAEYRLKLAVPRMAAAAAGAQISDREMVLEVRVRERAVELVTLAAGESVNISDPPMQQKLVAALPATEGDALTVEGQLALLGGHLTVSQGRVSLADPQSFMALDIEWRHVALAELPALPPPFSPIRGHLSGHVRGTLNLESPLRSTLDVAVELTDAAALGIEVTTLFLRARMADGTLEAAEFEIATGAARLHISEVRGDLGSIGGEGLPDISARLSLDVPKLSALGGWLTPPVLAVAGVTDMAPLMQVNWPLLDGVGLRIEAGIEHGAKAQVSGRISGRENIAIEIGPIFADLKPEAWAESPIVGAIDISIPDLTALHDFHPALARLHVAGSFGATITAKGPAHAPAIFASVLAEDFTAADAPPSEITIDVGWQPEAERLVVRNARVQSADDFLAAALAVEVTDAPRIERLIVEAEVANIGRYATLIGMRPEDIHGHLMIVTTGTLAHDAPVKIGEDDASAITLPSARVTAEISRLRMGGAWLPNAEFAARVTRSEVTIEAFDAQTPFGVIGFAGGVDFTDATDIRASFDRLNVVWRDASLMLAEPAAVRIGLNGPTPVAQTGPAIGDMVPEIEVLKPLKLSGTLGELAVTGHHRPGAGGTLELRADLHGLDSLLDRVGAGDADVNAFRLDVRLDDGNLTAAFDCPRLAFPGAPAMAIQAKISHANSLLTIEHIRVGLVESGDAAATDTANGADKSRPNDGKPLLMVQGQTPLNLGADSLRAMLAAENANGTGNGLRITANLAIHDYEWLAPWVPGDVLPDGAITGRVELTGGWGNPVVNVSVDAERLEFGELNAESLEKLTGIAFTGPRAALVQNFVAVSIAIDARVTNRSVELRPSAFALPSAGIEVTTEGQVALRTALSSVMFDGMPFRLGEGAVTCRGIVADLDRLAVPVETVRSLGGELSWDVTVSSRKRDNGRYGTGVDWTSPTIAGHIGMREGAVRLTGLPAIENISVAVDFSETDASVDIGAEFGGAPISLGGNLSMGTPDALTMELKLKGENALLFRQPGIRIRADLDVAVAGALPLAGGLPADATPLGISGTVALRDSRVAQLIDLYGLEGGGGGSVASTSLVLFSVRAEPLSRVQFRDLKIITAPEETIELSTNIITGQIRLNLALGGTLQVPEPSGTVAVENGKVRLPATSLDLDAATVRFLPARPFDPSITVFGRTRMMGYDVSVSFDGQYSRMANLEVNMSSDPPLPREELVLMVVAGKPPTQAVGGAAAADAAQRLAIYVGTDLAKRLFSSDDSLDDEGESIIDRIEVESGRSVSKSGNITLEVRFRLAEDVMSDRDVLYLEGERDIYDEYNAGIAIRFRFR